MYAVVLHLFVAAGLLMLCSRAAVFAQTPRVRAGSPCRAQHAAGYISYGKTPQ